MEDAPTLPISTTSSESTRNPQRIKVHDYSERKKVREKVEGTARAPVNDCYWLLGGLFWAYL
jgi:hypothetical protein